ncbi:RnfABCDGE type electron transport complex subunit D [Anaeromassilibacillus senegalensis]|uniref:RnfABCDGE type electron transport complex subunit D n=1 Tax=Anaeromassilibacillus senegalensis TaxID=1673717 RepID=UPI000682B232|nr:RnfABCDGE type electron transport complex subunit D [Anaeromassilibacillus senegalensis]
MKKSVCLKKERTSRSMLGSMLLALCTLLILPTVYFGWGPLLTTALTVGLCCLAELAFCLVSRKPVSLSDPSILVTGLVIALLMPVGVPYWVPAIAALFAVWVARGPFGGTGHNPFNPAAAGVAFVTICWPQRVFAYAAPVGWLPQWLGHSALIPASSPAAVLKDHLKPDIVPFEMLWGKFPGPVGATAMLIIGACGLYLILRRAANWEAPLFFLLVAAGIAAAAPRIACSPLTSVKYELMSGSLLFCAVFMMTDPVTAPRTSIGRCLYGAFGGAVIMAFRHFSTYEQGACFAVLACNAIAPLLDRAVLRARAWGGKRIET